MGLRDRKAGSPERRNDLGDAYRVSRQLLLASSPGFSLGYVWCTPVGQTKYD